MEYCTIYSHLINNQDVLEILRRNFPVPFFQITIEGTEDNWKSISINNKEDGGQIRFSCRVKKLPGYQLEDPVDKITKNLLGMYNFFKSIPTTNRKIQNKLLYKIASLNVEIGIVGKPSFQKNKLQKKTILEVTRLLDGIIFSGENSIFKLGKAENGLFDKNGYLVLDRLGKSEIEDFEVFIEDKYYPMF